MATKLTVHPKLQPTKSGRVSSKRPNYANPPAVGTVTRMTCPVCNTVAECTFAPDPFAHDVNGDDTPVWQCAECAHNSAMDI